MRRGTKAADVSKVTPSRKSVHRGAVLDAVVDFSFMLVSYLRLNFSAFFFL